MRIHNNKRFLERRKELRRNSTPQEKLLWEQLRSSKLNYRFRRQHSIGGYILDFYCFQKRLIIEIDGESHDKENDKIRDKYFSDLGYKTLRFKNKDVEGGLAEVLKRITLSLRLGEGAPSSSRGG